MRRFLTLEGLIIVLICGFAAVAGLFAFLEFRTANNRDVWMNYAHSLEATSAAAALATPTFEPLAPTVTLAASSTPVPEPTSTTAPTNTPAPLPTLAPAPTAEPSEIELQPHLVVNIGQVPYMDTYVLSSEEMTGCISGTATLTEVVTYGGQLDIKVYPPALYSGDEYVGDDGEVQFHYRLLAPDKKLIAEGDATNQTHIPCLVEANYTLEIRGVYVSSNGISIKFDNAGAETDDRWRLVQVKRGQLTVYEWDFFWQTIYK